MMSEEEVEGEPSKKTLILGYLAQGFKQQDIADMVGCKQAYVSEVKVKSEKVGEKDVEGIPPDIVDRVTGMTANQAKLYGMKVAAQLVKADERLKEMTKIASARPRPPLQPTPFSPPQGPISSRLTKVIADAAEARVLMNQFPELSGYLPQDLVGKTIAFNQQPPEGQGVPELNLDMALNDMKKLALMRVYKEMAIGGPIPGMTGQQLSGGQAQQIAELTLSNVTKDFELKLEQIKKKEDATPPPPQGPTETEKQLISSMEAIQKRLDKEDEDKAQKKLIQDVTKPYMDQIGKLEEKVEELGKPSSTPPKSDLEVYFDQRRKLKEEGFLQEPQPGSVIFGKEGIPIAGSVPAWAVYAPEVIDKVFANIETRLDRIVNKFGFGGKTPTQTTPPPPSRSLINLPEKPAFPPMTPVKTPPPPVEESKTPKIEEKIEEPVKEPIVEPAKTLVNLPEKPIEEKTPETPAPAVPKTPTPAVIPKTPAPAVAKPKIEVKPPVKPPDEEKPLEEKTDPEPAEPEKGYSKRDLEKMKMPQIWKLCNELGIHRGGKKVELIDKILAKKGEEE